MQDSEKPSASAWDKVVRRSNKSNTMLDTKFDELMDFPCQFPFKIIGTSDPQLADRIMDVAQKLAPGNYQPTTRQSSKGNYSSITVRLTVTSKAHLENLYCEFAKIDGVKRVL
jgi:putative lipoic acid-binding regulatory protein